MKEEIKFHEKYMLSVGEASQYFHIGESKLRQIINEQRNANWIFYSGQRVLIKRKLFENLIDTLDTM